MSIAGNLEKLDDGAFTGWIATLTFDVQVALSQNPHKQKDTHPDFHITAKSPSGRDIRVGSAWFATGPSVGEYLSLRLNVTGGDPLKVNAFPSKEDPKTYELAPLVGRD